MTETRKNTKDITTEENMAEIRRLHERMLSDSRQLEQKFHKEIEEYRKNAKKKKKGRGGR